MPIPVLALAAAIAASEVPPVPGLCSAPVPANSDAPGCYQTNELDLKDAPPALYWQVYEYPTLASAQAEAARHRWSAVAQAHSKIWLYVIAPSPEDVGSGIKRAVIGPLRSPSGTVTAHFSEAIFPPGMRTRVHSHPGPEAFYVVEGEQCMDTPADRRVIPAGGTYVVAEGPHLQAAPHGRRNLVLILAPKGQPFVIPGGAWAPTKYCDQ
jgi:quercetin dioxygenase-like cupin family protein